MNTREHLNCVIVKLQLDLGEQKHWGGLESSPLKLSVCVSSALVCVSHRDGSRQIIW
jgi:hypothetical protein